MDKLQEKRDALQMQIQALNKNLTEDEYSKTLRCGSDFFTEVEEYIFRNTSGGEKLAENQKEDILGTIENVFDFLPDYNKAMKLASKEIGLQEFKLSKTLTTAQSIYVKYRKKEALKYKMCFKGNGIPTDGFSRKVKLPLQTENLNILMILIGFLLFVPCLILVLVKENFTGIQYVIVRIVTSMGGMMIFAGFLKGTLEKISIKIKSKNCNININVVGYIVIFVIFFALTYLFNPPPPPESKSESELQMEMQKIENLKEAQDERK